VRSCVCGSDLWYYRGITPRPADSLIGHEFIGVIEEVGKAVKELKQGDFVIAPFRTSDGTCANCLAGFPSDCINGASMGNYGGQSEFVSTPYADTTFVKVPGTNFSEDMLKSFMALSDVMCTGYHAAVSAGTKKGDTVAVVGDGAVGLCAIISAKKLGAKRIIALSRNPARQKVAKEFGATDIVAERGEAAVKKVMELTNEVGVNAACECVGSDESIQTAVAITRPGGLVGAVGVPKYENFKYETAFNKNVGIRGGIAPARQYIPELLKDVLSGSINPGFVFDLSTDLDHISEAYAAMDERRAIKSLLVVSEL
jgi:threonine dehydrogenase-like Zn-dependent dehydrogenase